jgi:hypothetical protein
VSGQPPARTTVNNSALAAIVAALVSGGGVGFIWDGKADITYVDNKVMTLRSEIVQLRLQDLGDRIDAQLALQCQHFEAARAIEIRSWKSQYFNLSGRMYSAPACSELIE